MCPSSGPSYGRLTSAFIKRLNVIDERAPDLSPAEWKSLVDGFSDKLTDPTSAQIRKLSRSAKAGIVCGEVNARN